MNKTVIFWTSSIDDINRERVVGGLGVQMMHWASQFCKAGWKVFSLSRGKKYESNKISFLPMPNPRWVSPFVEVVYCIKYLLLMKPEVIIMRGASRTLFWLSLLTLLSSTKLVFMGASDTDFEKERELIASPLYRFMYRRGLHLVKYIVAQNSNQLTMAHIVAPSAKIIVIPNVWPEREHLCVERDIDCLWVANFRSLKRPEWFIRLAADFPQFKFCMVGAATEVALYEHCEQQAKLLVNLNFLGALNFGATHELFARARSVVCTSEIEGFPNIFLQAWSNRIPVLTTFDPSGVVMQHHLGASVHTYDELKTALFNIFNNQAEYGMYVRSIEKYFSANHAPSKRYDELMNILFKNAKSFSNRL